MKPPPPYFGWPKMNFDRIYRHFRSILYSTFVFDFVHKMAAGGHFGWQKISFDRISRHFRSIHNFFFAKWLPAAILDDRKSLLIAFLAISDQYAIFVQKMATGGHFGWPKIAFDHISRHIRSIRNFFFLIHKMADGGHFGWPKITFDCISHHFRSMHNFFYFFFQNGHRQPFWITENHFRSHFSPFQINTQFYFIFKMAAGGHFGSPISPKSNRVLPLCVINGYAKYEVDQWMYDRVREPTSLLSIFIQNGRQSPFCFSDWCQKS